MKRLLKKFILFLQFLIVLFFLTISVYLGYQNFLLLKKYNVILTNAKSLSSDFQKKIQRTNISPEKVKNSFRLKNYFKNKNLDQVPSPFYLEVPEGPIQIIPHK